MGADSFLYEMTPIYIGGNNERHKVASPVSVPIDLKVLVVWYVTSSRATELTIMTSLCEVLIFYKVQGT